LAQAGGLADQVQPIEARAMAGFFARNGELAEHLCAYFGGFNLIISYLYDPDGVFEANVGRCTKAQFIAGPHRPNEREGLHAAKVFLRPLERVAIFDADPVPRLVLEPADAGQPLEQTGPLPPRLALHPGSGSEEKNWPEASWADLLEHLVHTTEYDLLMVGGEAEEQRLQRLVAALPPRRVRLAKNLPLAELARLLRGCEGFIGHDSGISHLAAAVGLPGIVLWGDTAEEIWRPPSEKVVTLHEPGGLDNLAVSAVLEKLTRLSSRP
jgi:heptosyltransferase-2